MPQGRSTSTPGFRLFQPVEENPSVSVELSDGKCNGRESALNSDGEMAKSRSIQGPLSCIMITGFINSP